MDEIGDISAVSMIMQKAVRPLEFKRIVEYVIKFYLIIFCRDL
jgi:hypothetical protein